MLLDFVLNRQLGDFGLVGLYEHSENPKKIFVMGTRGYIAPKVIQMGKATPTLDVFKFSIIILEVACGR